MPSSRLWSGAESGLTISDIGPPGPALSFQVGPVHTAGNVVTGSSAPALNIPDARPGGVSDVITLAGAGTVRTIRARVGISHSYRGDLRVELLSPTARRTLLHNLTGGSADDLDIDLSSQPPSALTPLIGQPVAGDWQLRVSDNARIDTGTLDTWSLEITTGS